MTYKLYQVFIDYPFDTTGTRIQDSIVSTCKYLTTAKEICKDYRKNNPIIKLVVYKDNKIIVNKPLTKITVETLQ